MLGTSRLTLHGVEEIDQGALRNLNSLRLSSGARRVNNIGQIVRQAEALRWLRVLSRDRFFIAGSRANNSRLMIRKHACEALLREYHRHACIAQHVGEPRLRKARI